uniref:Protein kinase domain-containing protein n=1 Tax=Manihot esculenta TaxID=3983 RepID=A0A2C9UJ00_MANES
MGCCSWFLLSCLLWSSLFLGSHQLQSSQRQVLLQLRKHLEFPHLLEIWNDHGIDFCYISSSSQVNMSCQDNFVTELRITGDKPAKFDNSVGRVIPNQTLSENFSMDSFVVTLARLNSLRVLSLISLGLWGPLPDKIHRLSSLEYLDLSSNYLFGSVPPKISAMVKLQTLILDDNFFNDTVPNWFDSLSNLKILRLRNNQLKGPFPSSIQRINSLTYLVLSSNEISGKLPSLDALSNLHLLDLSGNHLDSKLPSMPKGLVTVVLSNNSFSGEIPHQYSQLGQLQYLDMSFNELSGTPPATIFTLPNISYLNLASNMLSGSLPDQLSCGSKLQFVDISNNSFTGRLPHCLRTESDDRVVKFDGNCLSTGLHHQRAESSCMVMPVKHKNSGGKDVGIVVGVAAGTLVIVVLLAFGFLVLCRRYCPRGISEQHLLHKAVQENPAAGFPSDILNSARFISQAAKLGTQDLPACRSFALEELKEATKNFDNSTILGEDSYGKLYKGRLEDGTQVAIRCLPSSKKYSFRNLKLRLDLLAKLRHPHLVCLLGHCIDSGGQDDYRVNRVFLIFEYISNGSFHTRLYENSPGKVLDWSERLTVLIGVAKAVHFLHTGVIPGFFNNRLKTNNILLNEHGNAKLSDYGLSIISEEIGNCGEGGEGFKSWQMARLEDDVYGFGFILLESLVGPSVSGRKDKLLLDELASCDSPDGRRKLISPIVLATCSQESLSIVLSITNKCICSESWSRPSFEDILWNLQYAAQIQATADGSKI